MKEQILNLKALGKKNKEIAKELNVSYSIVLYYTNLDYKTKALERTKKFFKNMSQEKRNKYNESRRVYNRNYMKRRYDTDLEFRKKVIERVKKSRGNKNE